MSDNDRRDDTETRAWLEGHFKTVYEKLDAIKDTHFDFEMKTMQKLTIHDGKFEAQNGKFERVDDYIKEANVRHANQEIEKKQNERDKKNNLALIIGGNIIALIALAGHFLKDWWGRH
jgi:arginyl-tRNA synthetase